MSSTGGGRFSEIYARSRAPSLYDIAQASGWTKQQRDARAMQQQLLARQDEQTRFARSQALAERQADQQRQAEEVAAGREKASASEQRYFANLLERNPNDPRILSAMRARGIEPDAALVSLPGGEQIVARNVGESAPSNDPRALAMEMQAMASRQLGAQKVDSTEPQLDAIGKRVILERAQKPGTPEFQKSYAELAAEEDRARMARARAIGGDKTLPAPTVQGLADADSAETAADRLLTSFKKTVPSSGALDQIKARVGAHIPNTDVAVYDNESKLATQIIGSYLEGATLKEADYARYNAMLPRPGDSAETAQTKVDNLHAAIRSRSVERERQLGSSGYRMPGGVSTPAPAGAVNPDHPVNKLIASGMTPDQAIEEYRRQQQGAQ